MDSTVESYGPVNGVVAPGQAGQPAPALVTLQPVAMPQQEQPQQASIRMGALLSAFRRRWFVAICLGLIASVAAATGVWFSVPDTYTAFAEMMVTPQNRFLFSDREMRKQSVPLSVYKQTNMRLAKYPFVLTAAIRKPEIAQSPTLAGKVDQVGWLEENIKIASPAEEFIRVSLTGPYKADVAPIVNAIVEAFKQEVLEKQRKDDDAEMQQRKEHLQTLNSELDRQRRELSNIDKEHKVANTEMANMRLEASYTVHVELRKELARLEWEILQREMELELLFAEKGREGDAEDTEGSEATVSEEDGAGEFPDFLVEQFLVARPDYVEIDRKLDFAEVQLKLYEKRFPPTHSQVQEKRTLIERLKLKQEEYRERETPLVLEELRKKRREDEELQQLAAGALADPGSLQIGLPADPVTAAKRALSRLKATRDSVAKELKDRRIETEDFTTTWVDREIKAEDVAKLKSDVEMIDAVVRRSEVERDHAPNPIDVRRKATEPKQPDRGKRMKLAGMAGFGLFGLVVGGVVLLEYSARRLNSVSEVQTDLNLHVMSTIPLMPRWVNSDSGNSGNRRSEYWHSVLTESVDATRTMLLRHSQTNSTKAIMIASATGGEGKTTLSCHLSTSLARAGRKVLLIDGDIRRPAVHRVFDLKNKPGLCEVLTDKVEFPDALHEASPPGLTVLTAGRVDADALRVLAQDRLGQMMEIAREQFDFIIMDTSPILPVTDALLMAQFMDGVVFSLRRDVSRSAKVAAAVQRVSMLGVNVLGAVAIGLDEGPSRSRYSYYHYGYGGYGANPHAPIPMSNGHNA